MLKPAPASPILSCRLVTGREPCRVDGRVPGCSSCATERGGCQALSVTVTPVFRDCPEPRIGGARLLRNPAPHRFGVSRGPAVRTSSHSSRRDRLLPPGAAIGANPKAYIGSCPSRRHVGRLREIANAEAICVRASSISTGDAIVSAPVTVSPVRLAVDRSCPGARRAGSKRRCQTWS